LGVVFLGRWQRNAGAHRAGTNRRRAELLIVAVIVLDVMLLFWKSARVVSPGRDEYSCRVATEFDDTV
jgi:hypothetical protein